MAGSSNVTGEESILFADNLSLDGTQREGKLAVDGDLWIGSTSVNAGGTHVNVGTIVGSGGISVGYTEPDITLSLSGDGIYKSLSPYIVGNDVHSSYATISNAITQAVIDGASATNPKNIYIKPQSVGYTEDITLSDGINLIGFGQCTTIIGKITFSTAGQASISSLRLQTNGDNLLLIGGSGATILNVFDCFLNITNNTGISYTTSNASSAINFYDCQSDITTTGIAQYTVTSSGVVFFTNCIMKNTGSSTTASNTSDATVTLRYSSSNFPISTSGTGNINIDRSTLFMPGNTTAIAHAGTSSGIVVGARIVSGTATAITIGAGATLQLTNSTIHSSNTNTISGAGTLNYGNLAFSSSSSNISTTVQSVLNTGNSVTVGSSSTGTTNTLTVTNSSNTASSNALENITVGGTSSGDPFTTYTVAGTTNWSQGIDNSDADSYVISASNALGTTNVIHATTAGEINYPLQPAFLGYLATTATDKTGNGTVYTIGTDALTETFDQGGDFTTAGVFTAPVTGRYMISGQVGFQGCSISSSFLMTLVTSNKSYVNTMGRAAGNGSQVLSTSLLVDMDANDTFTLTCFANGEAGDTVDISGSATLPRTFMSGYLAC